MGKLLFLAATVLSLFALQSDDPIGVAEYVASHLVGVGIVFIALAFVTLFAPKLIEWAARWLVLVGAALLVLMHAAEIAEVIRWSFQ